MTDGQQRTRSWSPDQLGAFVAQVRDDRFFALWMLIATTGIRMDALVDLRREDVDLQEPRLSPSAGVARPGRFPLGVVRSYALDPDAHDALRDHVIAWDKEWNGQRSDRVFTWADGGQVHPKSVEILFRQHCRKAGLPVVPLQAVRQAYVVAAVETGIPTAVISERLGHAVSPTNLGRIPMVVPPERPGRAESRSPSQRRTTAERGRPCHLRSC